MRLTLAFLFLIALLPDYYSQSCNTTTGNVIIFSNYDGGVININCDVNIPNLKIGVCTYEDCQINIIGPYAGNVTAVRYAGFQGDNDNCNSCITSTTITGVSSAISTVLFAPTGVLTDANGYSSIICGYSCGTGNQGGCNTSAQIVAYFLNAFGGTLRYYYTQYGCWNNATYDVSDNLCCTVPIPGVETTFIASDPIVCVGQCIDFNSISTGSPTSYSWTINGGSPNSSSVEDPSSICFYTPGTYNVILTASNSTSSDTYSSTITVLNSGVVGCTYPNATNYNPLATIDDQSCEFPATASSCLGDLNGDNFVGVADLILFVNNFGAICP